MGADSTNLLDDESIDIYDEDEEFDPLAFDEYAIDQENMDDDNPYDIIDMPTMRDMPETMRRTSVYSPEGMGSAQAAIRAMIETNPGRRPIIINLLELCEGGCLSSVVTEKVNEWQEHNKSVYEPMTFCRMLERAGGLRLEMPETAEEHEVVEDGVVYLEIKEQVDPIWHTTPEGLEVAGEFGKGAQFREMVLDHDWKYAEVYRDIMERASVRHLSNQEIEDLANTYEVTHSPRRWGSHFIDVLELTDAMAWAGDGWAVTDLGKEMYNELLAKLEA